MAQKLTPYPSVKQSIGITLFSILTMLLLVPLNLDLNERIGKSPSMLIYYVVVLLIPIFIFHFLKKKKEGSVSYQILPMKPLLVTLLTIITLALQWGVLGPLTEQIPIPELLEKVMLDLLLQANNVFGFITVAIAAPILEEILFRGIILDGLLKRKSPKSAILISSFLFAFIHLNPWQFFEAFVAGLLLGWVYYHTKNVGYCILIHFVNNGSSAAAIALLSEERIMNDRMIDIYGNQTNYIVAIITSSIFILWGIYFLRNYFKKNSNKASFKLPLNQSPKIE